MWWLLGLVGPCCCARLAVSDVRGNMANLRLPQPLLDALLDALLAEGLGKASTLLYGGCSAGGLTAYLHADYVASRMPAGVKVVALADAMFSRDAPTWDGATTFLDHMRWGYDAWNASSSGNTACIAHYGITEGWRCFFGCVKS